VPSMIWPLVMRRSKFCGLCARAEALRKRRPNTRDNACIFAAKECNVKKLKVKGDKWKVKNDVAKRERRSCGKMFTDELTA